MANFREQKLRVFASDPEVTFHADIYITTRDLSKDEHKKVISRVIRGVPEMLKNIPYTDFGIDNIDIKRVRRRG